METRKSKIEASFKDYATQQKMRYGHVAEFTWYESLPSAIKALKILQVLIGGEIQKGERILSTYSTSYVIESTGCGRYEITDRGKRSSLLEAQKHN